MCYVYLHVLIYLVGHLSNEVPTRLTWPTTFLIIYLDTILNEYVHFSKAFIYIDNILI